ncbi:MULTISPECIES: hypothetical protein [Pseudomonas]|uniref:Uncharacterized protein n=1 Tax=Phytopseudomonas flavescens TaxID=29435 RepID=A0A7Y9XHP4_9GAMM|nr:MULTISPECIES: hypothetical protein [Pseudomonas]MCW2294003.1 hypothetical protein [Pseudomonas sp. BIGb0408]NYH71427.1 hypothetical protein [Pseudomonas flavescens]
MDAPSRLAGVEVLIHHSINIIIIRLDISRQCDSYHWRRGASQPQESIITIDANDAEQQVFAYNIRGDELITIGFREKPVVSPVHHPLVSASS